jgi:hypothetical protein
MYDAFLEAHPGGPDGDEEAFSRESPGNWTCLRLRDGVMIQVQEAGAFEPRLHDFVRELERRGIEGELTSWEPAPRIELPGEAHLLEARLCVDELRIQTDANAYRWRPDPSALLRVLEGVDRWCHHDGPDASYALGFGSIVPVGISFEESVAERMTDGVASGHRTHLVAASDRELRRVVSSPVSGRTTLVVGTTQDEPGWWREPLRELLELLTDVAGDLVYAYVKRGWEVHQAGGRDGLTDDWPARGGPYGVGHVPFGIGFTGSAFDDLWAPDAFGAQVLGPGYADRLSPGDAWHVTSLAGGRLLVEHREPASWFDEPFVPKPAPPKSRWSPSPRVPPNEVLPPEVLEDARRELGPILYVPGVLVDAGFTDMDDRGLV